MLVSVIVAGRIEQKMCVTTESRKGAGLSLAKEKLEAKQTEHPRAVDLFTQVADELFECLSKLHKNSRV